MGRVCSGFWLSELKMFMFQEPAFINIFAFVNSCFSSADFDLSLLPFSSCVVFAGLFQSATAGPANFDPQSCSYPVPFCVVFAGLFQGAKGIPANFDRQMLFLPVPVLCGICITFPWCQGDPGKF